MPKSQLVAVAADHQSFTAQRIQRFLDVVLTGQRLQLAELEPLTDDTGRLQHTLLTIGQPVKSRRQDRVDALWHADLVDRTHGSPRGAFVNQAPFVDQHLDELFAEKWSARR